MEVKKVAILGAGNGGLTAAADLAERGFDISLYTWSTREYQFEGLINRGGLLLQEPNAEPPKEVFVPITNYTIDMAEAIKDAQVIMLTVPGYAVEDYAEVLAPLASEDQVIFFNAAAAMSCVRFERKAREMGIEKKFKLCELNTLTYGTRGMARDGVVELYLRVKKTYFAAYPKENTKELYDVCSQLYDGMVMADNIWETTLENGNPEVHPGPCLLNAGRIDYSGGDFYYYVEGVTEHTVRLMRAIEGERLAIGRAFGFELEDAVTSRYNRGYFDNKDESLQHLFNHSEVFSKIKGPSHVNSRYFTEDISDGLVLWSNLGKVVGVPTPNIDAVITIGNTILRRDFFEDGLTLKSLGMDDAKSVADLVAKV